MEKMKFNLPALLLMSLLLAILLLSCSCAAVQRPQVVAVDPGATLHLYLQPVPQEAYPLSLTVSGLSARTREGRDVQMLDAPWVLNAEDLVGRQTRLLQKILPVGNYIGLSLELAAATLQTEEGPTDLLIESGPQLIPVDFAIDANRAQTLFLSLHPERLVTGGYKLTARFSARKPQAPLVELQGVVSHPGSGLLTIFEKKSPAVVAEIVVGRQPAGLALDQRRRLIYLTLSDENSIAEFDLVSGRLQRKSRLHAGAGPTELALTTDGRTLLTLNPGTNSVSIINTESFGEWQRIYFSTTPASIFTGSNSRKAYVVLPDANALSLIDLDRAEVIATVNLADAAVRGIADSSGRQIYLLTENSSELLVVDAEELSITSRIHIGPGASCLTVNRNNGRVYVGMQTGEIAEVDLQAGLPIDSFMADPGVVDIVADFDENSLFVVSGSNNLLAKYDLVSKKKLAFLELAGSSGEVAVMGER